METKNLLCASYKGFPDGGEYWRPIKTGGVREVILFDQSVLFTVLAVAGVVFVVVLSIVLLSIRRDVDRITQQFEKTAEELRKTNSDLRGILSDVERGVSNVTHFTEGIRSLRHPMDVATKALALVKMRSAFVGFKAASSHILDRFLKKEVRK